MSLGQLHLIIYSQERVVEDNARDKSAKDVDDVVGLNIERCQAHQHEQRQYDKEQTT